MKIVLESYLELIQTEDVMGKVAVATVATYGTLSAIKKFIEIHKLLNDKKLTECQNNVDKTYHMRYYRNQGDVYKDRITDISYEKAMNKCSEEYNKRQEELKYKEEMMKARQWKKEHEKK